MVFRQRVSGDSWRSRVEGTKEVERQVEEGGGGGGWNIR